MLINTMALVTANVLQSALHSEVTSQFLTKPTIISNEENNNIEGKKQQESTNKAKDGSHSEQKIVNCGSRKNIKTNNRSNYSDKGIYNRFNLLNDNNKDSEDNKDNRENKKKD